MRQASQSPYGSLILLATMMGVLAAACGGGLSQEDVDAAVAAAVEEATATSTTASIPSPTTTTAPSTTTTEAAVPEAALGYFGELARANASGFGRASDISTGWASWYAQYLSAVFPGGFGAGALSKVGDRIIVCYPTSDGESCHDYADFGVNDDGLWNFAVDDAPLRSVLWSRAAMPRADCRWYVIECDFEDPELDTNLYLFPRFAFLGGSGMVILVIEVITGQNDFDLIWDGSAQRLDSTALGSDGTFSYPEGWGTNPSVALVSNLGLRIPRESRTYLTLFFPGFGADRGPVQFEIRYDWDGRQVWEFELPALPSQ